MKKIFYKIALLTSIVALVLVVVTWKFDSGYVDPFYTRFTTNKAPSLIIGTSRAAQGLLPQVFRELSPSIQNFAFTLSHSPFGSSYLSLIKKKLASDTRNGLFIVAVDPWAISSFSQEERLPEEESFISKIEWVNINPNFEYIFQYYGKPYYSAISETSQQMRLHKNGWLEVNIPVDSVSVQKRGQLKVIEYKQHAAKGTISSIRIQALRETVEFLSEYGEVYLVRLPVSKEMANIENAYAPDFDKIMQSIARSQSVTYLNYIGCSGEYVTTDGNHLYKDAGKEVSERIVSDIKQVRQMVSAK